MGIWNFFRQYTLPVLLAVGGAGFWVLDMISRYQEIMGMPGWFWQASAGALVLASVLVFFYRVHRRLEEAPEVNSKTWLVDDDEREALRDLDALAARVNASPPTYEGAHERLLNFVVRHLFPVSEAREKLHTAIIRSLCVNGPIAELARYGAYRHPNVREYSRGLEGLAGLGDSPPQFIPFDKMLESVESAERGYQVYLEEAVRLCRSGYVSPNVEQAISQIWEKWRVAHNEMVTAYEDIKRDSRMGVLFRPARESRWGSRIPAAIGAHPVPLMLREPEQKT